MSEDSEPTPAKPIKGPYDMFETDRSLETKGILLDYGSFYLQVARAGGSNTAYKQALADKVGENLVPIEDMEEEAAEKFLMDVFLDTVLLGWGSPAFGQGKIPDKEGNPMNYNGMNGRKLFEDLPDLFRDVRIQCNKRSLFRMKIAEKDSKN